MLINQILTIGTNQPYIPQGFLTKAGLTVGMSSLAAGMAIGVVGDAGVRANAQQCRGSTVLGDFGGFGVENHGDLP
jgi:V-type H+-transporting ATPase proteolipid subunit